MITYTTFTSPHGLLWLQLFTSWLLLRYVILSKESSTKRRIISFLVYATWIFFLPQGQAVLQLWSVGIVALPISVELLTSKFQYREQGDKRRPPWLAEVEIGANLAVGIGFWLLLKNMSADTSFSFTLPIPPEVYAAILAVTGALIFLNEGGTRIVRGFLEKGGSYPQLSHYDSAKQTTGVLIQTESPRMDVSKYNAGRLIGVLERWIAMALVVFDQYEALGFLLAGKSLSRAKEFENRDFSEYFILGTLSSLSAAVVVGVALKALLKSLNFL